MSLRRIVVCQNEECQTKGAKFVQSTLQKRYLEEFDERYPELIIESGDCQGECERGPVIKVNDSIVLREVDKKMISKLFQNPESLLGEVMHVLEQDRDTFERIIKGDLF
jgi:NADH:ubiquinone oxidoreductase subunit E